ncbi:hypothetical protein AO920_32955 [Pseudomonas aeruginosa]|nr:hypothetical protein F3H11_14540 [Pseudomonas aeruginosa]KAA5641951.1 hypothetical protein F3G63_20355 [Pseudomonas aeruginosa]MCO3336503.1 hypothetical protein [Pseudomonas aeruginosa]MCO3565814.1 hypothetical protein [Pseudomonas aeruginosa]OPD78560.1 hypothetical protein AO920_32955 [Pseudomonas aeruginosa]
MRIVAAGAALLLLVGCYSPSDLMKDQPGLVVASTKSAKAFALCALPLWQEHSSGVTMSETEAGYRLVNGFGQQTDEVLDIRQTRTGSVAKLYQRVAWSQIGRGDIRKSLYDCR